MIPALLALVAGGAPALLSLPGDGHASVSLKNGNLDFTPPLTWKVYGDSYTISK